MLTNASSGAGNTQTLTLGGLAQSGSANVMFIGNTLNTSANIVRVNGITTSTPAGQIIGPWATVAPV